MPPVPCGASRQTVKRSELAGWANYGYCAAQSRWYWGLKLYLITTAEGIPVAWYLADPGIGEWEVAADMLDAARGTGALRPGMIVLAGKGTDERRRYGNLGGIQQWIESVYDNRQVPAQPRTPRRPHPRRSVCRHRPAAAALAACIWHNWSVKTTGLRSLTGYDH
jgi:hypothetical protein